MGVGLDNMGTAQGAAGRLGNSPYAGNKDTLGSSGGSERHVLSTSEIPSHTHGLYTGLWEPDSGSSFLIDKGPSAVPVGQKQTLTQAAGSTGTHENMPPVVFVNYLILYQ
jgi:microcystin-dependent protein